jgi:hypothetical protein
MVSTEVRMLLYPSPPFFSLPKNMCNRSMDTPQSIVIGPATDALERSRKRRRNEERATKEIDEDGICLQDVYDDLIENFCHEESFPSIEWSDDDSEDCTSAMEHDALVRTRLFLFSPKQRDIGLRRSKSFRSDLSAMNFEEPRDLVSLIPSMVEPISSTHFSKDRTSFCLKNVSDCVQTLCTLKTTYKHEHLVDIVE